ncbi:Gfo/Idh/MocA family oxidoreductase [Ruminococcaceae bacterium OttesenSCG-928-L11]|nr:Gfo/Idh/MocA family oxidoreductase [Ruminococcaceae bacterium OttesenSCG-928-L11]
MKTFVHVGAGGWGRHWLRRVIPANREFAQCVAVVDVNEQALENAVEFLGLPREKCYTDLDTALRENPVDFITIASSIASHAQVVDVALRHGVQILSEKPIAGTMAECAEIYRKVKAAGTKFAVTLSHRYENDKQTLQDYLRRGDAGKINYLIARIAIARMKWRVPAISPEMLFIDGGVHNLDMIRAFSGANAEEVYARAWSFEPGDDRGGGSTAFAYAQMENGVMASLEYGFGGAYSHNGWGREYFRAECVNACVELDNQKLVAKSHEGYPIPEYAEIPLLEGDCWEHDLIMRQFLGWMDGGAAPDVTIDDSIHAMGMLFAVVESHRTGKPVRVKPFMEAHGLQL